LGFEENSKNFINGIKKSWGIAFFGAIAPFVTAYYVAELFWDDSNLSIMFGLAMMATAVSLTMVSLKAENLQATPAATGIMTSAVLDDIAALALVAILVPMASGQAAVSVESVLLIAVKVIAFFAVVTVAGIWVFPKSEGSWFSSVPFLGRFSFGDLLQFADGEHSTLTVLLLAVLTGLLAHQFGFHPAVGAYMAGLILREEYFLSKRGLSRSHFESTKKIIDNIAFSWLGPVFFVVLGGKLVFDWDMFVSVLPQTIMLTTGLIVTQVSSAGLAARYTAGFDFKDSLLIGLGMLGRAELAFVVIDIAYTQHGIFNTEAFYTLMLTSFGLNITVPVSIRLWKRYYSEPEC
jgi:Na+:H+ antiporter